MKIHKEGFGIIFIFLLILGVLDVVVYLVFCKWPVIYIPFFVASLIFFSLIVAFFRIPNRQVSFNDNLIYAPADGTVVVIEETFEKEYFNDQRIQLSIFMSPFNVHANYYPFSGLIKYMRHHHGTYLAAYHPKSAIENERTSIVISSKSGIDVLLRQVAGVLARRIICYTKENTEVKQHQELGFIRFGSRVDLYLPIGTKINVSLNQKVRGRQTVLAELPE